MLRGFLHFLVVFSFIFPAASGYSFDNQTIREAVERSVRYLNSREFKRAVEGYRKELREILERNATRFIFPGAEDRTAPGKRKKIYVFISSSIPADVLRRYVRDSLRIRGYSFSFVMRGFIGGMKRAGPTLRFVAEIISDGSGNFLPVSVDINPVLFRKYGIRAVPSFLLVVDGLPKKVVKGDASLSYIVERLSDPGVENGEVFGAVYGVAEPDALDEIRRAVAERRDFIRRKIEEAGRAVFSHLHPNFHLPPVDRKEEKVIDLTYVLPFDVTDGEGNVIYPAGYTFNPLDYIHYDRVIAVFDGCDRRQIRWVLDWISRAEGSVRVFTICGDTVLLSEKIGIPVQPAPSLLVERLEIEHTPALVRQEGNRLKVTYFPLKEQER